MKLQCKNIILGKNIIKGSVVCCCVTHKNEEPGLKYRMASSTEWFGKLVKIFWY